jgi:hypothetical protein
VYLNVQMRPDMQMYALLQQKDFYFMKTIFIKFMTSDADNHWNDFCLLLTVEKEFPLLYLVNDSSTIRM